METFNKTFFYKRDTEKKIKMSRTIKNLKKGDIIRFFGKLYDSNSYTNESAKTVIEYKIVSVSAAGVLIETTNKYIFNKTSPYGNGSIEFIGNIFSQDFNITDGIVSSYTTTPTVLSFINGTSDFKKGYGYSDYYISGNGLGEIKMNINLLA